VTPLERLPVLAIAGAMGLGFALSLLILMDQNISSAMVNTPLNKYLSKCQVKSKC
jgi:sodium borate transporter 11